MYCLQINNLLSLSLCLESNSNINHALVTLNLKLSECKTKLDLLSKQREIAMQNFEELQEDIKNNTNNNSIDNKLTTQLLQHCQLSLNDISLKINKQKTQQSLILETIETQLLDIKNKIDLEQITYNEKLKIYKQNISDLQKQLKQKTEMKQKNLKFEKYLQQIENKLNINLTLNAQFIFPTIQQCINEMNEIYDNEYKIIYSKLISFMNEYDPLLKNNEINQTTVIHQLLFSCLMDVGFGI